MSGVSLGPNGLPSDPAVLRARLADVDAAWHALMTGKQTVMLSYGQGNGTKSVTYTRASLGQLAAYRAQLLKALGGCGRRRPIRMEF